MPLDEYRRKRQFFETPEPAGRARRAPRRRNFVVQQHAATQLHYDFRLAIGGVLVSWAVPKGPSMNPADKRLAIRTEDHPLEYADFEGAIPAGHYGAGAVIVWDRGTYEPIGDVPLDEQLASGKLDFVLHGEKLRGGFTLVRTAGRPARARGPEHWLLIKQRDEYADPAWDVTAPKRERSVLTDRTLAEIEPSPAPKRATARPARKSRSTRPA
jgi:bifunctional non-homologous end joining protein LigD